MNDFLGRFQGYCYLIALILFIAIFPMCLFLILAVAGMPFWLAAIISVIFFVAAECKILTSLAGKP